MGRGGGRTTPLLIAYWSGNSPIAERVNNIISIYWTPPPKKSVTVPLSWAQIQKSVPKLKLKGVYMIKVWVKGFTGTVYTRSLDPIYIVTLYKMGQDILD